MQSGLSKLIPWEESGLDISMAKDSVFSIVEKMKPLLKRTASWWNLFWDLKYSKELQTMFVCTDLGIQGFKNQEFKTLEIHEFKNKILLSLGIYKNQFLLIGSGGAGLAIWDIQAGTYTILTTKDGLASNFIYFSKADPDNFIWVGTVKGIDRVSLNENLEIKSLKHFGSQNGTKP
jgi:ligand-binding sensor domain-containing protein